MSLQSDLELCLDYAEALEAKRDQRIQAQNKISYLMAESQRLQNKIRACTAPMIISVIVFLLCIPNILLVIASMATENIGDGAMFIVFAILALITFFISLFLRMKFKNEYREFESKKPSLIQRYTQEVADCERELVYLIKEIERENILDIVPVDYFSVAAISFCLTQVRKRLATTATEAFRQLDAEIKRMEQMAYLEELNNAQLEQLNGIKRAIDINTLVVSAELARIAEQENRYN